MNSLCDKVRQTAYEIHVYLAHGHLEKVYENALIHRLLKQGIQIEHQAPIQVFDEDGTLIGDYFADIIVEKKLIVELKTAKSIGPEHEAQKSILLFIEANRKKLQLRCIFLA